MAKKVLLSIIAPLYNEAEGLAVFHRSLRDVLETLPNVAFEIIYCNDGSTDDTRQVLQTLARADSQIHILNLTRNFGKEAATTAGIHAAHGEVLITLDADGQHPVELIPAFVEKWQAGNRVVIGIRASNQKEGLMKRFGSQLFYGIFSKLTGLRLQPGATDFRLIDSRVRQDFMRMTERNRITRGLIDWLGYDASYITFHANPRSHGTAGYSYSKLFKLAIDSMISLSMSPLYLSAYMGVIVLPIATLLGFIMLGNGLLGDPLSWRTTGTAYVAVLLLFLIGVLLLSQGIIGLYLSRIHSETQNRPLYIIDDETSNDHA